MWIKNNKRKIPGIYINTTPLVDVMLVLIIIFMITAPMMNVGVQVDLPKTKASTMNDQKSPIIISIDKNSKIYIEEAEVTLEDLILKLPNIIETGKTDVVYVRGDKDLQYGTIMEIMGALSSAGACKVSLISDADTSPNKNINPLKKSSAQKTSKSPKKKTGRKRAR